MDIKALQLEARFSLPPNSLGYCGRDSAAEKFKDCIINGKCKNVEEEVKHFIVLYPYLETIAEITKLPVFSYEVIEGYWIGNDLLKRAKPEHYDLLLKNFEKQGVPDFFVKELKQKPPKIFIPNHLFQVLHVGVGRASGAVPFNLKSINNCMIRWGEVIRIQKEKVVINLYSLELKNKTYKLIVNKETFPINTELVPGLKTGDIVVVHWNMAVKILTKDEEKKLKYWTKQCLVLF
jgi:hydrogenase maturation factor